MMSTPSGTYQVSVTAGSAEEAERLCGVALERRLAACAQVVAPVTSRYWWQGRLETSAEWLCLLKTTGAALDELVETIVGEHTYETPEVVATPIVGGSRAYLDWVRRETRGGEGRPAP